MLSLTKLLWGKLRWKHKFQQVCRKVYVLMVKPYNFSNCKKRNHLHVGICKVLFVLGISLLLSYGLIV